jgi:Predicted membrane protein (DUF2232)
MTQIVLVGLGAGAAAALLFASVISGALVSILLFYLAPLPILIAALGRSHWCGLLAAVTASACLGLAFGMLFFAAFLVGIAVPAWWLGYLALLARPGTAGSGAADLEWYPPGRLVLWAAGLGAVVVTIALFQVGTDEESIRNGLKAALERIFRQQTGAPAGEPLKLPGIAEPERLLDLFAVVMPPVAATASVLTLTLNLWIAARVVKLSGRLKRPWPDIPAMTFPRYAPALLAAAAIASFMPDLAGLIASLFAATLLVAFTMLGFAVLHALTRGFRGRAAMLSGAYAFVAVLGWPALVAVLLGLAESIFRWRDRMPQRGPPVAPQS